MYILQKCSNVYGPVPCSCVGSYDSFIAAIKAIVEDLGGNPNTAVKIPTLTEWLKQFRAGKPMTSIIELLNDTSQIFDIKTVIFLGEIHTIERNGLY